jgi:hypothetical protein
MRTITVYRMDHVKKTRIPIGGVRDRRKNDRGGNLLGLLRLARKIYGTGQDDDINIAVDNQEARNTPQAIEEYSSAIPPVPQSFSDITHNLSITKRIK